MSSVNSIRIHEEICGTVGYLLVFLACELALWGALSVTHSRDTSPKGRGKKVPRSPQFFAPRRGAFACHLFLLGEGDFALCLPYPVEGEKIFVKNIIHPSSTYSGQKSCQPQYLVTVKNYDKIL